MTVREIACYVGHLTADAQALTDAAHHVGCVAGHESIAAAMRAISDRMLHFANDLLTLLPTADVQVNEPGAKGSS